MYKKKFLLLLFITLSLFTIRLRGQDVVNSTGKRVSGSSGTVNFSIGQITFSSNEGSNGTVNEGIQHTYKITTVNSTENSLKDYSLTVFPNPTSNVLNLKIDDLDIGEITYRLYNVEGNLLDTGAVQNGNTSINMVNRVPSTYLLKLSKRDKTLKIFRIVKY